MAQGTRFGKYTLLDRISVGGMAEVFRATTADGKVVAIKKILPHVAEDPAFIKMFIEEARLTSQLVHPNVCRIHELGRQDGAHYLCLEFVDGKDLLHVGFRLKKLGEVMPPEIAVAILSRALDGLDYAHKKRDSFGRALELVHLDCSPHNLLLSKTGEVKVIDFGIAKAKAKSKSKQKKEGGALQGKFAYMAPEQVAGKGIDRRCDVFACGIVLYEIVTGEQLFTGDSDFAIMDKVRNAEIRRPRSVVPTLSAAIENVILKALVADRDQRYAWCSEMREDLDKCGGATQPELEGWARWLFATKDDVAPPEPPPDGYDDFEESPGTDPDGGALPPGW